MALDKLGYSPDESAEVAAYIEEKNLVVGALYVKTDHYPVFDCAIGERAIHYMGHVKMMGATQPFISGAISKTVNLPEQATVEEVAGLSRTPGVLASRRSRSTATTARSRSRCPGSRTRPRRRRSSGSHRPRCWGKPQRRRLPLDRTEVGRKFQVGDYEGHIHVGLYEDGTPGDIFVDIAKDGTTLQGLMNSLMIAVSMGLQYGVPPEVYVSKLSHMRFEPSGMTNDEDIRIAKSIVDYIFRWFGAVPDRRPAGGGRDPLHRGEGPHGGELCERRRFGPRRPRRRNAGPGPDGAVQRARRRSRVREVRRPDDPNGQLLHVPRLRYEHGCSRTSRQECRGARSAASVLPGLAQGRTAECWQDPSAPRPQPRGASRQVPWRQATCLTAVTIDVSHRRARRR